MSYLNSVTIIGFVGADPEQRQARNNNGSKFTVLSVATQRSWKNTDDEWASFNGLLFTEFGAQLRRKIPACRNLSAFRLSEGRFSCLSDCETLSRNSLRYLHLPNRPGTTPIVNSSVFMTLWTLVQFSAVVSPLLSFLFSSLQTLFCKYRG